jgi:hypothetical protein
MRAIGAIRREVVGIVKTIFAVQITGIGKTKPGKEWFALGHCPVILLPRDLYKIFFFISHPVCSIIKELSLKACP